MYCGIGSTEAGRDTRIVHCQLIKTVHTVEQYGYWQRHLMFVMNRTSIESFDVFEEILQMPVHTLFARGMSKSHPSL